MILLTSSYIRREFWYLPFVNKLYRIALEHLPKHSNLYHNALLYAARRGDIDLARQIFHYTPVEYRSPAIIQDIAHAEKRIDNFTEARNIYRSAFGRSGQNLDIQADTTSILSAIDQGKVDKELLTEYALFEHYASPESTYPIDLLRIAVEKKFDDAHTHHVLGRMLAGQKKHSIAILIYSEGEKRFPKSAPLFRLSKAMLQPTLEARAESLKASIEENVADAFTFQSYAHLLISIRQNKKAKDILEQGIKSFPNDPVLYKTYGQIEKQLKRFAEARKLFDRGLKADPTDAHLYTEYALMEKKRGRIDEARGLFDRGLKGDPTNSYLYNNYAQMEKELGRIDEARKLFEQGLKADPTNSTLYNTYGQMEKELGQIDEARELFERGLKADPTDSYLYNNYAQMENELGRIGEARELFERGLNTNPTEVYLYLNYADMEYQEGYLRRGLSILQRRITAKKNQDAKVFQMLGMILSKLSRFDQAEEALLLGLSVDSNEGYIFHQLAIVKKRKGDKEGTENVLKEGCSKWPNNLVLIRTMAQFLVTKGVREEAESFIEDALRICGENQLERHETEQQIYKPFLIDKPIDFQFVSQDQEGKIQKINHREKYGFGFIGTSNGERFYFKIPKKMFEFHKENDRVLFDLIEYPNRETNRFVAINVEKFQ